MNRSNNASALAGDTPENPAPNRILSLLGLSRNPSQVSFDNQSGRSSNDMVDLVKSFYPRDAGVTREIPDFIFNPEAHRLRQRRTAERMRLKREQGGQDNLLAAAFDNEVEDQNLRYIFMISRTLTPEFKVLLGYSYKTLYPTMILSNSDYVPRICAVCLRTYLEFVRLSEHVTSYARKRLNIADKIPVLPYFGRWGTDCIADRRLVIEEYLNFILKKDWVFQVMGLQLFLYTQLPLSECFDTTKDLVRLTKKIPKTMRSYEKRFFSSDFSYQDLYQYTALIVEEQGELGVDIVNYPNVINEYLLENPDADDSHPYDNVDAVPTENEFDGANRFNVDDDDDDDDSDDQSPPMFMCGSLRIPKPDAAEEPIVDDDLEANPINSARTPAMFVRSPPHSDSSSASSQTGACPCQSLGNQSAGQSVDSASNFMQIGTEERVVNTAQGPQVYVPKLLHIGSCSSLDHASLRARSSSRMVTLGSQMATTPRVAISGSYSNDDLVRLANSLPANMVDHMHMAGAEPIPGPSGLQNRPRFGSPKSNNRHRHLSKIDEEKEKSPKKKKPEEEEEDPEDPDDVPVDDGRKEDDKSNDEIFGIDEE
ncbi:uncharacterized protein LOC131890481 [Tigriopus californicus]|uniref:uncharacterized protein LOC131890481 n=1 Tax=Tigriopus californicus TaxID=6832 RepID=UPI0027DA8E4F|nr:uncharacterized protein LOC131890481 [Tigriopus californicus]